MKKENNTGIKENDKIFELLTKMYTEMNDKFDSLEENIGELCDDLKIIEKDIKNVNHENNTSISKKLKSLESICEANHELLIKSNELLDGVEDRLKEIRNDVRYALQDSIEQTIEKRMRKLAFDAMGKEVSDTDIAKVLNYSIKEINELREHERLKQTIFKEAELRAERKTLISFIDFFLGTIPEQYSEGINNISEEKIYEIIKNIKEIKNYGDIDKFLK